eukprot:CAMPEP_0113301666 /NCGR_PEP_ID=MMETSP0010_2-20120614/2798_1 /TAXON_ID=216773 ORGANISM="Corethron hystrix, Strain 308" /NCGR_SAMPLE_ID=MMETSP0010_2 /ASSEMBLY_ACC=CAM_ASM_000155 /LENGTH=283 /DNA_ID=CAMNT_0000155323 /DNA_START=428 /DNA_END=1275 /DNA_ORIENTATION=- /assembly_acc=CAM_ASM_000155
MGGRRPSWYSGSTPQLIKEDGRRMGESMDIVRYISESFFDGNDGLYPDGVVERTISKFRDIFPKRTRPSSRSAFLFTSMGGPVSRADFDRTLRDADEMIAQNRSEKERRAGSEAVGPFLAGTSRPTAADVAYVPFLERYAAQLPLLHEGLDPRNAYPHLKSWYEAMDSVPSYISRVKGCDVSWGRVLGQVGFGNAGAPPHILTNDRDESDPVDEKRWTAEYLVDEGAMKCWEVYAEGGGVATTPWGEAAARIVQNRIGLVKDMSKFMKIDEKISDEALRVAAG